MRAAGQLYRYAQQTSLCIEAYEACSRCEEAAEGDDHRVLRVVPARRTIYSDESLWMFVHCVEYLREMKTDPAARKYLREHVSIHWWETGFLTFGQEGGARLQQALAEDESDSPRAFVELLNRNPAGAAISEEWLAVLTGHWLDRSRHPEADDFPLRMDRCGLLDDLMELCVALQYLFPEETLSTGEAFLGYHAVVFGLATWGRADEGVPFPEQHQKGIKLVRDALDNPPKRYASRSQEEKVVWSSTGHRR